MSDRSLRSHRVTAFCDWLETVPPRPPFHTRPEFRFYRDLTGDEIHAAMAEMARRGAALLAEADALTAEGRRRGMLIGDNDTDGPEAA